MSDIRITNSDYVQYVLQAEGVPTFKLEQEPNGWTEDSVEIVRHKQYHGIFVSYTNSLEFRGEAKDYIKEAFRIGGINADLRLIKYKLVKDASYISLEEDYIKYKVEFTGLADFSKMQESDNAVELPFNSNDLEVLVSSHESDSFEMDRLDSIDGAAIPELETDLVTLEGRLIEQRGISDVIDHDNGEALIYNKHQATVLTKMIVRGNHRHDVVTATEHPPFDRLRLPENMFFIDNTSENENPLKLIVEYDTNIMSHQSVGYQTDAYLEFWLFDPTYDGGAGGYVLSGQFLMYTVTDRYIWHAFQGEITIIDLPYNKGLVWNYKVTRTSDGGNFTGTLFVEKHKFTVTVETYYDPTPDVKCMFVDNIANRLMRIITGERYKFYSRAFGRQDASDYTDYSYPEDGDYGLIALTYGFWARSFRVESSRYKALTISIKDLITSLQATLNIGVSIETVNFKQRLRFEKQSYYYQNKVVVKLPYQVTSLKRKVDPTLYFSGITAGYDKGGGYEDEVGLDEPNIKTAYITPIRKSTIKYEKLSKIRADETGLEMTRRKPELIYPDEDTPGDDNAWYLDLKRSEGDNYIQKIWIDRLEALPTGIFSPETFRSMFFTPSQILKRHGWILRAGLEQVINLDKYIRYANSGANITLSMQFLGELEAKAENEPLLVRKLDRAIVLPEVIEFEHPVDDDIMDLVNGTTPVFINGEWENVPNVYFKFQFINNEGKKEAGFLLELKGRGSAKFKLQKANETLIQ